MSKYDRTSDLFAAAFVGIGIKIKIHRLRVVPLGMITSKHPDDDDECIVCRADFLRICHWLDLVMGRTLTLTFRRRKVNWSSGSVNKKLDGFAEP